MTSREHARRLMLILLSSDGAPRADAPQGAAAQPTEDGDGRDERSESDRPVALAGALVWT